MVVIITAVSISRSLHVGELLKFPFKPPFKVWVHNIPDVFFPKIKIEVLFGMYLYRYFLFGTEPSKSNIICRSEGTFRELPIKYFTCIEIAQPFVCNINIKKFI